MTRTLISHWPSAPSDWPQALRDEFAARAGNGQVGSRLVSETDRVRVWLVSLKPGERIGFHTHVLDYFWMAVTAGQGRSHYADGRIVEASYQSGDTRHLCYGAGEFMIHDFENIGETELLFTTVEFLDSANAPLALPSGVAPERPEAA